MHDETSIEQRGAVTRSTKARDDVDQRRLARAAATAPSQEPERSHEPEEMPRVRFTRRRLLASVIFVVSTVAFLYFVLPRVLGLRDTWNRIQHGNAWWLVFAAVLEVFSFCGYVVLFRVVFVRGESRIDWRASYQITMAGLAATRLFASAGAGGIALTAWALTRSGLAPRLGRLPDDRVHGPVVRGLHGRARDRRAGPLSGAVLGLGSVCDHRRAGDLRRRRDRDLPRRVAAAGRLRPARQALAPWRAPQPARGQGRPRHRQPPPAASAPRLRSFARATSTYSARLRGGGSTSPCCGRAFTPSARRRRWP